MPPIVDMPESEVVSKPTLSPVAPGATSPSGKPLLLKITALFALIIVMGVGTGYSLATKLPLTKNSEGSKIQSSSGKEVGIKDEKTFRDCSQGELQANDLSDKKAEGTHKLIREGGPSQTLYMTSSVLPLDDYIGKKVEVCGETLQSKKVPWFMDVGKLKLLQ